MSEQSLILHQQFQQKHNPGRHALHHHHGHILYSHRSADRSNFVNKHGVIFKSERMVLACSAYVSSNTDEEVKNKKMKCRLTFGRGDSQSKSKRPKPPRGSNLRAKFRVKKTFTQKRLRLVQMRLISYLIQDGKICKGRKMRVFSSFLFFGSL